MTPEEFAAVRARAFPDQPPTQSHAQPVATSTEDRTRALNLAYQLRSHPASRSIDEIEQAGEVILAPLSAAPVAQPVPQALSDEPWHKLYRRAINEANGLTNYVDDRPELRSAERRISAIEAEARTLAAAGINGTGGAA